MTSNVAASNIDLSGAQRTARRITVWTPAVAYVSVIAAVAIYAIINGPAIRAAADSHKARQIEQENIAVCQRFGMPRGTDTFAACANSLADIRRNHEERIMRDLVDFF